MVSLLLCNIVVEQPNRLPPLSIDSQLFFLKFFSVGLRSVDLEIVLEHSFYVLYHPVTFNSLNGLRFIHIIVQYKFNDNDRFNGKIMLGSPVYNLRKWKFKFPPSHSLYQIMLGATSSNNHLTNEQVGSIPNFIRNVHHHYVKVPKKLPHVSILNFLNRIIEQLVYIKYIYFFVSYLMTIFS
jgi:hypothetical protein